MCYYRQNLGSDFKSVSELANSDTRLVSRRQCLAEALRRGDSFERAAHDQARPHPVGVVAKAVLEELRVRQDDPELVVEPVEQARNLGQARLRGAPAGWLCLRRHG